MNKRQIVICTVLAAAALALGGCISAGYVADKIVGAPNGGHPKPLSGWLGKVSRAFYTSAFTVPVGPPPAVLAVAVIAPRNYGFGASAEWGRHPKSLTLEWSIQNAAASASSSKPARQKNRSDARAGKEMLRMLQSALPKIPVCRPTGTVILLPGWGEAKETLLGYALDFANRGYRVILVDLRGQGESSGEQITYGLIEHRDMTQLISALDARGLIAGKLALVGFSEGATVALDTAANDVRVAAVVAVAPFVDLRTAIRGVGHDFMPTLSKMVSPQKLDKALAIADAKTGLNLADSNPSARVGDIRVPVLYVAGGKDDIAPAADVHALAAKTRQARFVEIPGYPHPGLYFGVAKVGPPALDALAAVFGDSPDPDCLVAAPPKDALYHVQLTLKLTSDKEAPLPASCPMARPARTSQWPCFGSSPS